MASLARGSETSIHSVDRSSPTWNIWGPPRDSTTGRQDGLYSSPVLIFFRDISPRHTEHEGWRLSRLHESSIVPHTHESIISPTIILAPIQWDIMTEITEAQATDPPPGRDTTQSHVCTICSASESHSMGTLYPQFRVIQASLPLFSYSPIASGGPHCRPILSSTFGDAPPVMYPSPLTNYLLASYNLYPFHNAPGLT